MVATHTSPHFGGGVAVGAAVDVSRGVDVDVGRGVAVGCGVDVGRGVDVNAGGGVDVGRGVEVGCGVDVGATQILLFIGPAQTEHSCGQLSPGGALGIQD